MSSAPAVDDRADQVTVKRVPGGVVSNWLIDHVGGGRRRRGHPPAGRLRACPGRPRHSSPSPAGSGITPIISLVKAALATTDAGCTLLYANRDPASMIFADELDRLGGTEGGCSPHRSTSVHGFLDVATVVDCSTRSLAVPSASGRAEADVYVCGPTPFMDIVEAALLGARGRRRARSHIERFSPRRQRRRTRADDAASANDRRRATLRARRTVTIEIDGRTGSTEHHPGTTILQTARQLGLTPPYSCESGSCATCMAKLVEGTVTMHVNNALTDDEVAEGWVLTCQSVPTSPTVHVVYE